MAKINGKDVSFNSVIKIIHPTEAETLAMMQDSIKETNDSIEKVNESIASFNESIASFNESIASFEESIDSFNGEFEATNGQVSKNKERITDIRAVLSVGDNIIALVRAFLADHPSGGSVVKFNIYWNRIPKNIYIWSTSTPSLEFEPIESPEGGYTGYGASYGQGSELEEAIYVRLEDENGVAQMVTLTAENNYMYCCLNDEFKSVKSQMQEQNESISALEDVVDGAIEAFDNVAIGKVDSNKFDELKTRVEQLESATLQFTEESTVAYESIVPANSAKYALVNKVGGMTYKNNINNYLTLLWVESNATSAEVTINADNSITIDKQNDDSGWVSIVYQPEDEKVEGRYFTSLNDIPANISNIAILSSYVSVDENENYYDGERSNELNSWIPAGDYYRNGISTITFYLGDSPMTETFSLILTDTDDIWQGLRDAKVTELVSEHGNLFNFNNVNPKWKREDSATINIDTASFFTDLITGTAGGSTSVPIEYINKLLYLTAGTYYAYFDMETDSEEKALNLLKIDKYNGAVLQRENPFSNGGSVTLSTDGYYTLRKKNSGNAVISNLMITRTPRTKYEPYNPSIFPISAELRAFLEPLGYGRGVNAEYYNYIDFERKVFVQRTYRKVFDGLESISVTNATSYPYEQYSYKITPSAYSDTQTIQCIASHMTASPRYRVYDRQLLNVISAHGDYIQWTDEHMTAEAMRVKLKAWYDEGNPLVVEYRLAEPIEADISAFLDDDNFIEVEGGGTIRAVNEYELDAPTTIAYVSQKGS